MERSADQNLLATGYRDRIIEFALLLFAFCLPINTGATSYTTALFVICAFILPGKKHHFFNIGYFLFYAFYIQHFIGLFYSENEKSAWFDLQVKLPLLILPLAFSTIEISEKLLMRLLKIFVLGCFISVLICFYFAYIEYKENFHLLTPEMLRFITWKSYFTSEKLAVFIHHSYLSLYYDFAIAILFLLIKRETKYSFLWLILIMVLSATVILLASKSGIILLFFIVLVSMVAFLFDKKIRFISLILLIVLPATFYYSLKYFPNIQLRFEYMVDAITKKESTKSTNPEGSAVRIMIWEISTQIIKENKWMGVGTGDVKDELVKYYEKDKILSAQSHKLNAHNQYLQTGIALGGIGFFLLVAALIFPLWFIIKNRDGFFLAFMLILIINLLFESMLERQAGLIAFVFFYGVFLSFRKNENYAENELLEK